MAAVQLGAATPATHYAPERQVHFPLEQVTLMAGNQFCLTSSNNFLTRQAHACHHALLVENERINALLAGQGRSVLAKAIIRDDYARADAERSIGSFLYAFFDEKLGLPVMRSICRLGCMHPALYDCRACLDVTTVFETLISR